MCGRFIQTVDPERIRLILPDLEIEEAALTSFRPRYNVAPSQNILVVLNTPRPLAAFARWGLIPRWSRERPKQGGLINARAETLARKPSFRDPYLFRRCLVFADGFYEWDKDSRPRTPHLVRLKTSEPFAMAALWDTWADPSTGAPIRSCAIVTTRANRVVGAIHDRMPAILDPAAFRLWLSPSAKAPRDLEAVLAPFPDDLMETFPVSPRVNDPSWDTASCIEPTAPGAVI